MSIKKINVASVNEFAEDVPEIYVVDITPELIDRIHKMSALAIEHDLQEVTTFDYSGKYQDEDNAPDEFYSTECNMLCVDKKYYRWIANPKNHGDAWLIATDYQEIPQAEPEEFQCIACHRPEGDCSRDPCPEVIEDRAEQAGELPINSQRTDVWAPESIWDNHSDYPMEDWTSEVCNGETRQGYIVWVNSQIEAKWLEQEEEKDA